MLKGQCPHCGLRADLDVFALAADANNAFAAALAMPAPLSSGVMTYLRLFSPCEHALAMSKAGRLLESLAVAVNSAQVSRNGLTWAAPLELWRMALDIVVSEPPPKLPLTNHNYLFQVVANLAAKATGKAERQAEATLQRRVGPQTSGPVAVQSLIDRALPPADESPSAPPAVTDPAAHPPTDAEIAARDARVAGASGWLAAMKDKIRGRAVSDAEPGQTVEGEI